MFLFIRVPPYYQKIFNFSRIDTCMVLKIPVTEKHHIEIGKVSTHFALLESYISNLIIIFLEKDQRIGQIITSNCSFQRLMDLLSSLAKYKLKDLNDLSDLEDLMKRANQV